MAVTTGDGFQIPIEVDTKQSESKMVAMQKAAKTLGISTSKLVEIISKVSEETKTFNEATQKSQSVINKQTRIIKIVDESTIQYTDSLERAVEAQESFQSMTLKAGKSANKTGSIIGAMASAIGTTVSIVERAFNTFSSLVKILEVLSDPEKLKRLTSLLRVLALIQKIKGNRAIADGLEMAADKAEEIQEALISVKETAEKSIGATKVVIERATTAFDIATQSVEFMKKALVGVLAIKFGPRILEAVVGVDKFFKIVTLTNNATDKFGGALRTNTLGSMLKIAKVSAIAAPALIALGSAARNSENAFFKFAGTLSFLAGILLGGFSFAIFGAIKLMSSFAIAIGDKLITSMTNFEKQASKAERAIQSFEFVMKGFARVVGEDTVGSLEGWNDVMDDVISGSTFAADSVRKSIKLLVAEGSKIGLTFEDTSKLLKRAADVASANGKDIIDVTNVMVKGLINQTEAAKGVGIFLDQASLAHSNFAAETNASMDAVSDGQKVLLRYAKIFEDTEAVVGAAASDIQTVAGATEVLNRKMDRLGPLLGRNSAATVAYIKVQQMFVGALLSLPDGFFAAAGGAADFLGVLLKITGVILKYIVIVATLATVYGLLTSVTGNNLKLQQALSFMFLKTGRAIGVQTVGVTSLSSVWLNLSIIMKGGVVFALKAVGQTLVQLTKRINMLLIRLAPLLIQLALISSLIWLTIKAVKAILPLLGGLNQIWDDLKSSLSSVGDSFKDLFSDLGGGTTIVARLIIVVENLVKILVVGLLGALNSVLLAWFLFKEATADTAEEQAKASKMVQKLTKDMVKLSGISTQAIGEIVDVASGAGEAMAKVNDKTKQVEDGISSLGKRFRDLGDDAHGGASDAAEALKQLEGETRNLTLSLANLGATQTQQIKNNLSNSLVELNLKKEQLKSEKLLSASALAQINLQRKLLNSQAAGEIGAISKEAASEQIISMQSVADMGDQLRVQELEGLNKLIEAQRLKNVLILENFDKEADALKDKFSLNEQEIALINQTRQALEKKNAASLVKAGEEQSKAAATPDPSGAIITTSQMAEMGSVLGDAAGGLIGGAMAAANPVGAFMAVANMITGAIQSLIDFLPNFLNAIAGIFNSLTELPTKLVEALVGVFDSIINFIKEFPAQIVKAIDGLIMGLVDFIANIPDAVIGMVDGFVNALLALVQKLPQIIGKLVSALISFLPKLISSGITLIVKGVPAIISAVISAIPEIITALVDGFVDGVKTAINSIASALGLGDVFNIDTAAMVEQFEDLADTVSKSASKIFSVADLEAQAKGLGSVKNIQDSVATATKQASGFLQKLWDGFIKGLKAVWMFIWDKILSPIIDAIRQVWLFIWDKVLKPIIDAIRAVWLFVWEKIIQPIGNVIGKAFEAVGNILRPIFEAVGNVLKPIFQIFMTIGEGVANLFKGTFKIFGIVGDTIGKLFKNTFKIFGAAGKAVGKLIKAPIDFLKSTWDTLMKIFTGKIGILDGVRELFQNAFKLISDQLSAVAEFFGTVFDIIGDNLGVVFEAVGKIFSVVTDNLKIVFGVFQKVGDLIGKALGAVFNLWKKVGEGYIKAFKALIDFWKKVGEAIGKIFTAVFSFGRKIFDAWIGMVKKNLEAIGKVFSAVFSFGKKIFDAWLEMVKKNLENIKAGFMKLIEAFKNVFEFIKSIFMTVIGAFKQVFEVFKKAGEAYINALKGAFEALKNAGAAVGKIFSQAWDGLKKAGSAYFNGLKKAGEAVGKIWTKYLSPKAIIDMFKKAFDAIKGIFSKLFDFKAIGKGFGKMMDILNPQNLLAKIFKMPKSEKGKVENLIGIDIPFVKFAEGGPVPGTGNTDSVPSLLTPGEFVLTKDMIQSAFGGLSNLMGGLSQSDINQAAGIGSSMDFTDSAMMEAKKTGGNFGEILLRMKKEAQQAFMDRTAGKRRSGGLNIGKIGGTLGEVSEKAKKVSVKDISVGNIEKNIKSTVKNTSIKNIEKSVQSLADDLEKMFDPVAHFWDEIMRNLVKGIESMIKNTTKGIPGFAQGGLVGGTLTGVDSQMIRTTPGEFVVNRSATSSNLKALGILNQTGSLPNMGSSGGDTILNVTINAKTMLSPEQVQREVVPIIEKSLRRSSMRGKFLLSNSGTRDNR